LPGVQQAKANPATGTLLIRYRRSEEESFLQSLAVLLPALDGEALRQLRATLAATPSEAAAMASGVTQLFRQWDQRIEKRTGGADLRIIVPMLLVLLAAGALILAALRRRRIPFPSWYDLVWFAFNTFIILNLPIKDDGKPPSDTTAQN
jgi:hypothetical protein